jgi:hypothetical protein
MFAAHPAVSSLPETSFLRRYAARNVLQSIRRKSGLNAAIEHLEADSYFTRTQLNARELTRRADMAAGHLDLQVYRLMLKATKAGASGCIVDKDPRMIEFLPLLQIAVPGAHVVNIIRDPRDVLVSKKKVAWARSGHVWKHIFANRIQLRLGRKEGKRLFGVNFHEVIYEELISRPDSVLFPLCERLGLAYDASMLNFGAAAGRLVTAGEMSWKKETLGRLLDDNKGKWKHSLPCREVRLTESCCGEAMKAGGYAVGKHCTRLSFADRLWVWVGKTVIAAWTRPYQLYRAQLLTFRCNRAS